MNTFCNGKHTIKVEAREVPHPALTLSKARKLAWEKYASDEEFYQYLSDLAAIYAKRHYTGRGVLNENALFLDFKKWKDGGFGGKITTSSTVHAPVSVR